MLLFVTYTQSKRRQTLTLDLLSLSTINKQLTLVPFQPPPPSTPTGPTASLLSPTATTATSHSQPSQHTWTRSLPSPHNPYGLQWTPVDSTGFSARKSGPVWFFGPKKKDWDWDQSRCFLKPKRPDQDPKRLRLWSLDWSWSKLSFSWFRPVFQLPKQ